MLTRNKIITNGYCAVDRILITLQLSLNLINRISNMRFKNLFRTFAVTLLLSAGTISAAAANYVKVTDKAGAATTFALSEKPTVTFTADKLVLKAGSQTVEYPLADMVTFEFADQPTGINTAGGEETHAVFSFSSSSVRGEGLKPGSRVEVYTVNGQLVSSARVSQSGSVEVPLNGQTGVFIVKSSNKTFKFINK